MLMQLFWNDNQQWDYSQDIMKNIYVNSMLAPIVWINETMTHDMESSFAKWSIQVVDVFAPFWRNRPRKDGWSTSRKSFNELVLNYQSKLITQKCLPDILN